MGESTLASWLKAPSEPEVVRQRQAAIEELRDQIDLREEIAILGADVRSHLHPEALVQWAKRPLILGGFFLRLLLVLLALSSLSALSYWIWKGQVLAFSVDNRLSVFCRPMFTKARIGSAWNFSWYRLEPCR